MISTARAAISESAWARPAPALQGLIGAYHGYHEAGIPPGRHRGLPSPCLTLIITLDEPLTVARHLDPSIPSGRYTTLAGGLHTQPVLITHDGVQSGVHIDLTPLGTRALLGFPAGELGGIDVDAAEVLGPTAAELHERMRAAAGWRERFAVLNHVLAARADHSRQAHPGIVEAWRLLARSGGTLRTGDLATAVGWSPRHLRNIFRAETGLAPKAAGRVMRFDRACTRVGARVRAGQPLDLAALAADCGYFDQPHLAREFRDLAGCSPSAWVGEEFRNVQARGQAGAPGWAL